MPVAICRIIANNVALPNAYQYDAPPGTSSVRKPFVAVTTPVRWSSQVSMKPRSPLSDLLHDQLWRVALVLDPRDLHFSLVFAVRQRIEAAQRRSRFMHAQLAELRTVTRADELIRFRVPGVFAAEVRADRAEHHEANGHRGIRQLVDAGEELGPRLMHLRVRRFDGPDELLGVGGAEIAVGLVNVERHLDRSVGGFLERRGLLRSEPRPLVARRVHRRDQRAEQRDDEAESDHAAQRDDGVRHEDAPGLFFRRAGVLVRLCVSHVLSSMTRRRARLQLAAYPVVYAAARQNSRTFVGAWSGPLRRAWRPARGSFAARAGRLGT